MVFIRQLLTLTLVVVVAGVGAYVLWFNQETVSVSIPSFEPIRVVAALAYLIFFVAGMIIAACYFATDSFRKSWEISRCHKRLKKLEAELSALRGDKGITKRSSSWFGKEEPSPHALPSVD